MAHVIDFHWRVQSKRQRNLCNFAVFAVHDQRHGLTGFYVIAQPDQIEGLRAVECDQAISRLNLLVGIMLSCAPSMVNRESES